ncbi:MAG: UDP-N-acetylmuramate dehydrogenase [Longimonas sp.]|uniref:UDP-N-acetylmuramate dehydrogenase n=1 Tax=Longimonas sp. TaxID=2039626 RepID=UPI00334E99AA
MSSFPPDYHDAPDPLPDALLQRAVEALRPHAGASLQRNVPLAPYTTFKIGGPADLFWEVHSADELATALQIARTLDVPHHVLGTGANLVIGDYGVRGLVIRNAANGLQIDRDAHQLRVGSGAIMYPDVIHAAVDAGLSGLEHYVGIPSTVGGALWQNLHFLSPAPERERTMFIEEVVHAADILTEEGERRTVGVDYFDYGYDYSILHDRNDIVLSATFQLAPGSREQMRRIMEENLEWRALRHPPLDTEPSVGSIFKKIEGVGAGRLIDGCGLKGVRVGMAEVTHRHANIFVNRGGATAADVCALIAHVQQTVEEETGYHLDTEITFVGQFASPSSSAPYRVPKPEGIVTAAERAKMAAES